MLSLSEFFNEIIYLYHRINSILIYK